MAMEWREMVRFEEGLAYPVVLLRTNEGQFMIEAGCSIFRASTKEQAAYELGVAIAHALLAAKWMQ